jgi:hypothetical protein
MVFSHRNRSGRCSPKQERADSQFEKLPQTPALFRDMEMTWWLNQAEELGKKPWTPAESPPTLSHTPLHKPVQYGGIPCHTVARTVARM